MEPAAAVKKKKPVVHPKYRVKNLRRATEDSEGALEGLQSVPTCDQDGDEVLSENKEHSPPPQRTRRALRIALKFPTKGESKNINPPTKMKPGHQKKIQMPTKRKIPPGGDVVGLEPEVENGKSNLESSDALLRRSMNIKENKAVLAQLLAELNSVPDLFPMKTPPSKPKKSRRSFSEGPVERRTNPSRSARPPENFALEKFTASAMQFAEHLLKNGKKGFTRRPLTEEEREEIRKRRRSSKYNNARPVEEITEEELDNVADTVKDKVYDKIKGSTCHQCRQKTLDTKTICRYPGCGGVRGQFCGPCLRNRYGEDVREALLDPEWVCPPCRDICNCSYCRKKDGRCATGMLIYLAKFSGYDNVKEYLETLSS